MKNNILRIIIVMSVFICVAYNIISSSATSLNAVAENDLTDSLSIEIYENADLKKTESNINKLTKQKRAEEESLRLEEERLESYYNFETQLKEGKINLRQLFSDTYFAGDSLMHGLNSYRVLDSAKMSTMVNASLYHLRDNINRIVANNPSELVLHYGINMLVDSDSSIKSFIELYSDYIDILKEQLPDTEIYISSIFNVSEKVSKRYSAIGKYNDALKQMCSEKDVKFIDNSVILPGDGSYYGEDGIHLSKEFYSDVWLPHLFYSMSL